MGHDYDCRRHLSAPAAGDLNDGNDLETIVPDLRVRNYTVVETSTPLSSESQPTIEPLPIIDAETAVPTPTTLPENPAAIRQEDIIASIKWGSILAIVAFIVLGVILGFAKPFEAVKKFIELDSDLMTVWKR